MAGELVYPRELDLMEPGTVNLGVPTLRDVLQVNAVSVDSTTRIHVEKTESDLMIVREDGRPMQVTVRYQDPINRAPGFRSIVADVFTEPAQVVELTRHPSHPLAWQMGREMPGCNIDAAALFLSAIGVYGRMKQAKTR